MSPTTHISDDPLPPADPVTPLDASPEVIDEAQDHDNKLHLENPEMGPVSSYGRTDPASLAAVQSHELSDPNLDPAAALTALDDPTLTKFTPGDGVELPASGGGEVVESAIAGPDFSNWDPHLAHLAQVGLTPADHWDEQIKPRIDQLHDDITQVNEQLDDLEKATPKPKKS